MKLSLTLYEKSAVLRVIAENNFEKEALEMAEVFPEKTVIVSTSKCFGSLEEGSITISFNTKEQP